MRFFFGCWFVFAAGSYVRKLCESACACMMFAKSFGVLISYAVSAVGESDLLPGHKFRRIRARGPGFDVSRITLCVFVFCVCVQGDISKSLTMLWRECKQHPCFVGHREVQVADQNHILPLEKQTRSLEKRLCIHREKCSILYSDPRLMLLSLQGLHPGVRRFASPSSVLPVSIEGLHSVVVHSSVSRSGESSLCA